MYGPTARTFGEGLRKETMLVEDGVWGMSFNRPTRVTCCDGSRDLQGD